jgi:hypothetical protein
MCNVIESLENSSRFLRAVRALSHTHAACYSVPTSSKEGSKFIMELAKFSCPGRILRCFEIVRPVCQYVSKIQSIMNKLGAIYSTVMYKCSQASTVYTVLEYWSEEYRYSVRSTYIYISNINCLNRTTVD